MLTAKASADGFRSCTTSTGEKDSPAHDADRPFAKSSPPDAARIFARSARRNNRRLPALGHDFDLKQLWPQLAGDKQTIAEGVIGDSVQNVDAFAIRLRQDSRQIDPSEHAAVGGRDAGDLLGLPDVGVQLAAHPLKFVEVHNLARPVMDRDAPQLAQRQRVPDADLRGAVVHVNARAVVGEAPALALIGERAPALQRRLVVDESDLGAVGELEDLPVEDGDPFAEIAGIEPDLLHGPAGFQLHLAQRRAALQAGGFIQEAAAVLQPFGEGFAVVRIDVHHPVAVLGRRGLRRRGRQQKQNQPAHDPAPLRAISSATSAAAFIAFTSWTRIRCAPLRIAATAAAMEADSVSGGEPLATKCLREAPAISGSSSRASSPSRARISAFCSLRLPNPRPGSMTIWRRSIPARTAR